MFNHHFPNDRFDNFSLVSRCFYKHATKCCIGCLVAHSRPLNMSLRLSLLSSSFIYKRHFVIHTFVRLLVNVRLHSSICVLMNIFSFSPRCLMNEFSFSSLSLLLARLRVSQCFHCNMFDEKSLLSVNLKFSLHFISFNFLRIQLTRRKIYVNSGQTRNIFTLLCTQSTSIVRLMLFNDVTEAFAVKDNVSRLQH